MTKVAGLLRLTRASIAASAVADAAAGAILAASIGAPVAVRPVLVALLASLALFLFGMAQNDLADRVKDARLRPDRPIPSGAVTPAAARIVVGTTAAVALVAGLAAGGAAGVLVVTLIASITLYNLGTRHLGAAGPLLLGAIRAQNLTLGAAALGVPAAALPAALCYFVYVSAVSAAARMEDGEVAPRALALRLRVRVAELAALAAPVVVAATRPEPAGVLAVGAALAVALWLVVRTERVLARVTAAGDPPPAAVAPLIGACLSGLLLFDAAVVLAAAAWVVGLLLVAVFPASRALARRFPPS